MIVVLRVILRSPQSRDKRLSIDGLSEAGYATRLSDILGTSAPAPRNG